LHSLYGPGTRRLLLAAGLRRGMRAADLGCGAGTVTALLSERVGPEGSSSRLAADEAILELMPRMAQVRARRPACATATRAG
jgi:ubiquinone/menaquinone biosynthesis C-methylase UbiE